MKKFFVLATAAMLITGTSFAEGGKKGKGKKCEKMGCCTKAEKKSCCKDKTAKM